MLGLKIELQGDDLFCRDLSDDGAGTRRPLTDATLARLRDWASRYDRAVTTRDWDALAPIGREIADFLDEGDAWLTRCLGGTGEIAFEIAVAGTPDDLGRVLLDVPWELLAPNTLFLAADGERLFRVERRLGKPTAPRLAAHRDLALVFMAADVDGQGVLNYEQEESAILQATQRLDLNLIVEESGALEFLGQTLAQEDRPEALHLSCHGTIAKGTPVVILETPAGGAAPTAIANLAATLGDDEQKPALIFISACRTAEHGTAASAFTQALVRAGVANALGWDGSVYDADAIGFAETFYAHLAHGRTVAHAAAQARRALLQKHLADREQWQHWHLARVYLGPAGGGALCAPGKPKRPFRKDAGYREFLDKKNSRVPVASAAEFVGRRRQVQRILRAFRDRAAGVLVHGMGNLGKSSLAARVAGRMPRYQTVVLFERYDVLAVFDALVAALPPRLAPDVRQAWREAVINDERALAGALQEMLDGPFRCEDRETKARPILLIIDDLEQILETPQPGETATPVRPAYAGALAAIITAFAEADATESRLLLTSRYTFSLGDGRGGDLADRLLPVPVPPMDAVQRDKQMHAAAVLAAKAKPAGGTVDQARLADLAQRIKDAAGGNPGLQEILSRPLLQGEADAAAQAVAAVEHYLATGAVPSDDSDAIEFFQRVSLEAYRAMLTPPEAAQLRAATLFSLPVPRRALHAAGAALDVADPAAALARLEGLGLVDLYVWGDESVEAAANPLARPLVQALTDDEAVALAKAAVGPLYRCWDNGKQHPPCNPLAVEVARLGLLAKAPAKIVNRAATGATVFLSCAGDDRQALHLVKSAVAHLDSAGATPNIELLRFGADCAGNLGECAIQDELFERGVANNEADSHARARLLHSYGHRLMERGEADAAEAALREAVKTFDVCGDQRNRAKSVTYLARIATAKGSWKEALRILEEDVLPSLDQSLNDNDNVARASVMGEVAIIRWKLGEPNEALRILKEQLPVFERVGNVRERARTMGNIADILQECRELDEALRIRLEEELPVWERYDDALGRALTMGKIADIREARGELDEALRIREEEELPVYERMRMPRERAMTWGKIASIWELRGYRRKALRIRRNVVLPVFQLLDDPRLLIVELGRIAENLETQGKLDAAIKIHIEGRLPVAIVLYQK